MKMNQMECSVYIIIIIIIILLYYENASDHKHYGAIVEHTKFVLLSQTDCLDSNFVFNYLIIQLLIKWNVCKIFRVKKI